MGCCTSFPTAAAGGTCTAGRTANARRRRWRRCGPSSACPHGRWAAVPMPSSLLIGSPASTARKGAGGWRCWTRGASALNPVETPYTEMSRGDIRAARGRVVLEAAAADLPSCLVSLDLGLDEDEDRRPGIAGQPVVPSRATRLRQSQEVTVGEAYLSAPRAIAFETSGGETAHRHLLSAVQPRLRRPARGAPAAAGPEPRRTDRARRPRHSAWAPSSGPAAASRWWT